MTRNRVNDRTCKKKSYANHANIRECDSMSSGIQTQQFDVPGFEVVVWVKFKGVLCWVKAEAAAVLAAVPSEIV